jgi:hypothetical protein
VSVRLRPGVLIGGRLPVLSIANAASAETIVSMIIRCQAQVIAASSASRWFMTLSPDMPVLFGNQFEESAYSRDGRGGARPARRECPESLSWTSTDLIGAVDVHDHAGRAPSGTIEADEPGRLPEGARPGQTLPGRAPACGGTAASAGHSGREAERAAPTWRARRQRGKARLQRPRRGRAGAAGAGLLSSVEPQASAHLVLVHDRGRVTVRDAGVIGQPVGALVAP